MSESVVITEAPTGPDAPTAQDNSSERPTWLPEKFNSAEDMAKSYSELEKKLSGGGTSEDKQEQEEAPEQPEETDDAPKDGSPDFTKFSEEFAKSGVGGKRRASKLTCTVSELGTTHGGAQCCCLI